MGTNSRQIWDLATEFWHETGFFDVMNGWPTDADIERERCRREEAIGLEDEDADHMNEESLRNALRRAAGALQSMHVGHGHKGINGEAVTALATADACDGETWGDAVEKARARLQDDFPNSY